MRPLDDYIGRLLIHTPKAIKRGEPADRVFAVVDIVEDQGRRYLLAWKCTKNKDNRLHHPAYKSLLDQSDARLFCKKGRNGSEPTAMFRPDSFYKEMA